ncbi:hypothetical protein Ato02nite_030200 [Paractinoplanes toevensis]|uniref:Activator of Hsp90 ATPase homologue 1/2-like C-terminal domain-containing protein n=1 Tax=Paractinoplanes toevensis TaxID=571911 RepID=A0A919TA05_9ACTN|nr:hypothetical protein Ato02nite_030200 [Actinoplanes toevensis]
MWRALTEPELLAKWWVAGDIKPVVGHRFTLDMGNWGNQVCEVLEVEEETLLRHTFAEGVLDTTITWRLVPEGSGTRLFLTHDGFEPGSEALIGMGSGWPRLVARIVVAIP